jgi:hypothetical protein
MPESPRSLVSTEAIAPKDHNSMAAKLEKPMLRFLYALVVFLLVTSLDRPSLAQTP